MIWLLLSVSNWPMIMIAPGGLLLVVPHLFAIVVQVSWVWLQGSKWLNLDVKNNFAGSHNEHSWRSSYEERWLLFLQTLKPSVLQSKTLVVLYTGQGSWLGQWSEFGSWSEILHGAGSSFPEWLLTLHKLYIHSATCEVRINWNRELKKSRHHLEAPQLTRRLPLSLLTTYLNIEQ
jgi:hypothetical protein